jgi:hypothetical protein
VDQILNNVESAREDDGEKQAEPSEVCIPLRALERISTRLVHASQIKHDVLELSRCKVRLGTNILYTLPSCFGHLNLCRNAEHSLERIDKQYGYKAGNYIRCKEKAWVRSRDTHE